MYAQGFPMDSSWSAIQEIISALGNENNGIYLQNVQDGPHVTKGKMGCASGEGTNAEPLHVTTRQYRSLRDDSRRHEWA